MMMDLLKAKNYQTTDLKTKMIALVAAGGVLYRLVEDSYEVLLIRRNGYWDIPKGKLEDGETVEECARREVSEEIGIPLPQIVASLDATWHSYVLDGETMAKTTHWFLMTTTAQLFTPQVEEQIELVEWVPLEQAVKRVGFDNLRMVLGRARIVLTQSSG